LPSSDFEQIETIIRLIRAADPRVMLDIGVGFGKYGVLAREYLEVWTGTGEYGRWQRRIEGVEAFPKYLTPLHDYIYDRIHVGSALEIVPNLTGPYDLILLIDVIEHFSKLDAERLLAACECIAKNVLIATPRTFYEQEAVFDNPYEEHRSHWTRGQLTGRAGFSLRAGRSWIALRGRGAADVRRAYRRRLAMDRLKIRFPRTAHAGIRVIEAARRLLAART
jgi:hypothetical protein